MIITLNKYEERTCEYIAKCRTNTNKELGKVNRIKVSDEKQSAQDLEGVRAEFAYCKGMNVYPDFEIATGMPPIADCYTVGLGAVDVKTTKCKNGHLIAHHSKINCEWPDHYALMISDYPKFRYVGYAAANDLFKPENLTAKLGKGDTYMLSQDKLKKEIK